MIIPASLIMCLVSKNKKLLQVTEQQARLAELRQAAAAAASNSADRAARMEHHTEMLQAKVEELQTTLTQKAAEAQQHHARWEVCA